LLGAAMMRPYVPWSCAGAADPEETDQLRAANHARLTDRGLEECFVPGADYEQTIRALDLVWDCPDDRAANVVGHCCARCGRTRDDSVRQRRAA
jgi:hypothetical protein